ncbi:MAG TPA: long-chain fatty acid--CoA ligase [Gemmatimonadales bacterium]|nr:long-chain fatty acid--CoA ligase [Gemmatimonadales bacterium]
MADPRTLNEIFFGAVERWRDRPVVMRVKRDGRWQTLSYAELLEQVRALSFGLGTLGVGEGDRVAILSENRPEWAIADYACLAGRAADVPVYPTLPALQVRYLLKDSGAVAVFVSSREQREKIDAIRTDLPALRHVITMDESARGTGTISFTDVLEAGRRSGGNAAEWRARALAAGPDDLATIIYTSGTTGDPKGVMLTHGNITSNVVGGLARLPLRDSDECLSFLPLSHIFERMAGHYCMMQAGAIINYATSVDTVAAEMAELRPTVVLSVPRLYEKVYARVLENALSGSFIRKSIFFWAKRIGERWTEYTLGGKPIPPWLATRYRMASRLVFAKLRARVGGRIRFFVSGGAPLSADIARFFYAAGLPILEGYGLTETSPVIAVNGTDRLKLGTVGPPLGNVQVEIAPDGEILTRGPHVMHGYFNKPEATAEAIDANGWFHTGDIGMLDAQGFLRITDRKKDLIVTAGGKNIAPQPIENRAKTSKFVSNAVMLGDRRKFPIILVVPNREQLETWAGRKGIAADRWESLLLQPPVRDKMDREVQRVLQDLAHFEMPKKVLLLPNDFTIESGELTPTLKVRRRVVEQRYAREIDALYADADQHPPPHHEH